VQHNKSWRQHHLPFCLQRNITTRTPTTAGIPIPNPHARPLHKDEHEGLLGAALKTKRKSQSKSSQVSLKDDLRLSTDLDMKLRMAHSKRKHAANHLCVILFSVCCYSNREEKTI